MVPGKLLESLARAIARAEGVTDVHGFARRVGDEVREGLHIAFRGSV